MVKKKQRAQTQMNFYSPSKAVPPSSFLYKNNESAESNFLQKQLNIQGSENIQIKVPESFQPFKEQVSDKLKSFQNIMDRHHQNPTVSGGHTMSKNKNWDIFKNKRPRRLPFQNMNSKHSQSPEEMRPRLNEDILSKPGSDHVPKLNLNNLEKVDQKSVADQLSVMGQQKDIKESAFSQVSVSQYSKQASLTTNRIRKDPQLFTSKDAKKQLSIMNLAKVGEGKKNEDQGS